MNDGRRLVTQALARRHQTAPELSVLTTDLVAPITTQVNSEPAVLCEHASTEGHVRSVRRLLQFDGSIAKVEIGADHPSTPTGQPGGRREFLGRKGSPRHTGPFAIVQCRR